MHYQSDGTQVAIRPTARAVVGTPGYVQAGNAASGTVPSNDDPDLMNAILDEIANVVTAAGIALDKTNNAQLQAALLSMFGGTGVLGGAGWMRLPGGVYLQWGSGLSVSGGQTATHYSVAFPNAVRSVVISEQSSAGWGNPPAPTIYGSAAADQYGFICYSARIATNGIPVYQGGLSYNWMAIGY